MPYYYYPPYNQDILANKPYYFPYDQYQQQTNNQYRPETLENKKESNKNSKKQDETALPNLYSFGQNSYFSYYPSNYNHYNEASNYYQQQQAYLQQPQIHTNGFGSPKITVKDYVIPLDYEYQTPELSRRKYKKHHVSD
jgi:hypothetical protein